jgi:hypothetical protein
MRATEVKFALVLQKNGNLMKRPAASRWQPGGFPIFDKFPLEQRDRRRPGFGAYCRSATTPLIRPA